MWSFKHTIPLSSLSFKHSIPSCSLSDITTIFCDAFLGTLDLFVVVLVPEASFNLCSLRRLRRCPLTDLLTAMFYDEITDGCGLDLEIYLCTM
jgi:hypothetical protein